jgi:hypothetical protein
MKPKAQIVYYLDNTNMSIVEIESDVVGLKDILWIIYYKSKKTINFFKFRYRGSVRVQERNSKRGFFHGSKDNKQLYIEIDHLVVPSGKKLRTKFHLTLGSISMFTLITVSCDGKF